MTKNDNIRAEDFFQQPLEIGVCRDQDEVVFGSVAENAAVPGSSEPG